MKITCSSRFIFLFLTTGVISEIGTTDPTYVGAFIDSRTFRSFEVFITLTVLYWRRLTRAGHVARHGAGRGTWCALS